MIDNLVRASVEGAVMVGGIWFLSRALPLLSPAVRATLWWCAAAKVLVTLLWSAPLVLPVLAPDVVEQSVAQAPASAPIGKSPSDVPFDSVAGGSQRRAQVDWTSVALVLWAAGVAFAAAAGFHQWRRIRATVDRSAPADPSVTAIADEIATLLALEKRSSVRMSEEIESPLIVGLFRPVVLLPATRFPLMDLEQQRMAICHEFAHMKRRDVWLGCVPAMAERIFFFHPLVRLAAREYIFWREAACDAAVLRALGTAPQAYGRLLLNLGVTRPQPALAAGGAAWSFSNLKRRIIMLQQPSNPRLAARIIAGSIIALAVLAVVPLRLGAREVVLPPVAPPPSSQLSAVMPAPAVGPVADISAAPEEAQEPRRRQRDELRFVYMSDETTTMSGSSGDVARARRHRNGAEPILWFMQDGKEYVIRDPEVPNEIAGAWDRVSRLGAEQGEIGAKQGEIGARQGRLGARQGRIGAEQGAIGARQAEIAAREVELARRESRQRPVEERREIESAKREVEERMRELDREMLILDGKMHEEDKPMSKLTAEMQALGVEMEALGKQMEGASRDAEARMRTLIERAVANGTARQVK